MEFVTTEQSYEIGSFKFKDTYGKYGVVGETHAFETLEEDIDLHNYLEDQAQAETVKKALVLISSLINELYKRKIFEHDYSNCNY